ncbi:MAG: caspase family protein, partial [Bacteroidales bacterium]|nr:caspase family protein [Bacteroidales bacterium]
MNKIGLSILIILLFSNFISASDNPSKYALIIAVADYPETGGWSAISSDNDVALIKDALLKQGFTEENIKVILNESANKEGIVNELNNLTNKVSKGDIVVVHFSGHGQQIRDNENNDEIDGYDESVIPYDSQVYCSTAYRGENHLRDDEITFLLNNLRSKLV